MKEEKSNRPKLSDNLEEAAEESMPEAEGFLEVDIYGGSEAVYSREQMLTMYKAGAEWQKEQDQETIELAEDHAMLAGRMQMKEQMMKDAMDAIVENWNSDPEPEITIPLNPEEFTCGDKVRVIIIKEEG